LNPLASSASLDLSAFRRQYQWSPSRNGYGVLEMGRCRVIRSSHCPSIGQRSNLTGANGYHWLEGEYHTDLQLGSSTWPSMVRDLRLFVHLATHTVTDKVMDDRKLGTRYDSFDRMPNISHMRASDCRVDGLLERQPSHSEKSELFTIDLPDCKGLR